MVVAIEVADSVNFRKIFLPPAVSSGDGTVNGSSDGFDTRDF